MKYYKEFNYFYGDCDKKGNDNTIYSFDIETTSYLILDGKILNNLDYLNLTDREQSRVEYRSCMYIWMFSINKDVYYGRTWEEFIEFLNRLELFNDKKKIVFVHNLSFEFQYIKSILLMKEVLARKKRKVMKCVLSDYNIEFRCSYMMSNSSLANLPKLFDLPVEKKVGDLDYNLIRTSDTVLTDKELGYCEYDCLVIYYYILKELEIYKKVGNIPLTSTGHVRRELKKISFKNYTYRRKVKRAINVDPHIYNLLIETFSGGYTHANWIYTDKILNNVDSWDFTSSYPYVLVSSKFPSSEFKKCNISKKEDMISRFAYILVVRYYNIRSNYYNNFISTNKCRIINNSTLDNGRVISADYIEIVLTDVDFNFINKTHTFEKYEILESYYSLYDYLPKDLINFILDKYVKKTTLKNVEGSEVEYVKEKNKFNSIYGMCVTNFIRDKVEYDNDEDWTETELTNDEILEKLYEEKEKSFLSFSYGVWVTAIARNNLLENVVKLDEYVIYCDTDSIKLLDGYNKKIIDEYNENVIKKVKYISKILNIDYNRFSPKDIKGNNHLMGLFENDESYVSFITQGAKKYAYTKWIDKDKVKKDDNILEYKDNKALKLSITVSGVPKGGANALTKLEDFKDNLLFEYKHTKKNMLVYCDNQDEILLKDYQDNKTLVTDKSGCCAIPTSYLLSKSLEYANLISDNSSKRSIYREV